MEYVYTALILNETDEEITEENVTAVLESAGADVEESRVKALVAAVEDVDFEEAVSTASTAPAAPAAGGTTTEVAEEDADAEDAEDEEEETAEDAQQEDDDDDEAAGEGLGNLFG